MRMATSKRARHLLGNDLVREARRRAGLTQSELAALAGTTQSAIARLETGRSSPSFESVLALIRHCGLDLEVMLVERDDADLFQAQRSAALTPTERIEGHQHLARQLLALRRAGEEARHGAA